MPYEPAAFTIIAEVKTWITDSELEATRKANPYQYVKDVKEKIKAAAPDDKFKQVKMIHDLLALLIPYDVSILPGDQADYLFMPRLSELLEDDVDQETGDVEKISCVRAIAAFIDRWIGSGKWTQEPL